MPQERLRLGDTHIYSSTLQPGTDINPSYIPQRARQHRRV